VRSDLLYEDSGRLDPDYIRAFETAGSIHDLGSQTRQLAPDLIYVHRLGDESMLAALKQTDVPVVRFFHDHRLFCLREHKYTAIRRATCTRPTGARCYACLGCVTRGPSGRPQLRRLRQLEVERGHSLPLEAFVVGSRYMAGHVAEHGFDSSRIHVIPLFVRPPSHVDRVHRSEDLLLFVGQLVRGKGLDLLLRALARSGSEARLYVAGTGRQEHSYQKLAQSLGLNRRVRFLGMVTGDDLSRLYARAACTIVPSRVPETFGLVGPESLSHGTPVIASQVGGMDEWLTDGKTGLSFRSGDVAGLAAAIDRLVSNPRYARRLGGSGRRAYLGSFRPDEHVRKLLTLFTQLIGERR
jgi:glycosyltransferase involved in cell wall biosynthesis